jgi:DUF1680 family protein
MKLFYYTCIGLLLCLSLPAQNSLVHTANSPYARLGGVGMQEVQWTNGFWAERFKVCRDSMVPHLWDTYTSKESCFAFQNFRVAAGLDTGRFRGPSFHDGDFYKTLEAVASLYAVTRDPKLDRMMDTAISVIAAAQKPDGYIYTKSIIEQRKTGKTEMFEDKLSFEAYNFGHLMTAACIHYRITGKTSLLKIATKATDFLLSFYQSASPEQARNAICPAHYMGIIEMYRTTGAKKYLELAKKLIDIRGKGQGSDDNSDRLPFRDMKEVNGHAVRANYLFAGVADVYAETGDPTLLSTLNVLWNNVIHEKMYVTGGCGALYDGLSQEGISYKPDSIEKIQQAYGKAYQLPNKTAHNETCANIGNVLWNWRMLQLTGDAKYADIMELCLYNSVLSGISLDGNSFFYTNPLTASKAFPYDLRWSGGRSRYISRSNCCPPNTIRTIAQVSNYVYSIGEEGIYVNLYGSNKLNTNLKDGSALSLEQQTSYPWSGKVNIRITKAPVKPLGIHLRIPDWCARYTLKVNGKLVKAPVLKQGYLLTSAAWKAGDQIELLLDMPVSLLESNPLVEETRNQVAVKRGPIVYCLESADLPAGNISSVVLPSDIHLTPVPGKINDATITALTGEARMLQNDQWGQQLFRPLDTTSKLVNIQLVPYYAWSNRGQGDMSVWLPVARR